MGHLENLKSRFKKRDSGKNLNNRYVPPRLKVSSTGAQMCGYLKRKTTRSSKWKRMWFVLKERVLYIYRASEDTVAVETFPILGYDLDVLGERHYDNDTLYEGEDAALVFILSHAGAGDSLVFCAENEASLAKWTAAIREAVKLDNGNNN